MLFFIILNRGLAVLELVQFTPKRLSERKFHIFSLAIIKRLCYNKEEEQNMYDFITDLDDYFCKEYANYNKLCVLPGYVMPLMQRSEVREDGRTYAYTLPAETMSLANQQEKESLLQELKKNMVDMDFSFSFRPISFFARLKNKFSKYTFYKNFKIVLNKYGMTAEEVLTHLTISGEIWKNICQGKFEPTKNLLYSLALTMQLSYQDTVSLMTLCGYEFDNANVKDVVIAYLLKQKVYDRGMIDAALEEYKITNLFLK